ncbi:beta-N-acetylhexosaminidase [Acrocarpospora pleiomorpha]|uniref:beta-N-acetylhexosaminidase n=1 Tax=Acrocarpospora pleiomorpha TaxID=90975 RepID=UPI001FE27574|nr:beta-N-acetylhexosaminidase [Acrocarpospora pleiomorpha]
MRATLRVSAGVCVTFAMVVACSAAGSSAGRTTRPSPSAALSSPPITPTESEAPSRISAAIQRMTVEEKVGQLFMPVLYGSRADATHQENQARFGVGTPAQVIEKYHLGGMILFPGTGNIVDARQLAQLTAGLRAASPDVPFLIGVDQENGLVSRLGDLVTKLPGAQTLGETGNPANARAAAKITGTELRALGISMDFAPVADVNVNPRNPVIGPRAYGSDPDLVADMVSAAVKGFHDSGIAATAKHFPGHGDTATDSHTALPVIRHTRAEWERLDAPPFRAAITSGVDAIMTAHILMPRLDPSGDPATLSKKILTGLLRNELGFKGVISTDALNMEGVRKKYGDSEVAVRAILAGADILLMPPDLPTAYEAILTAIKSGRITQTRLNQSVHRILKLKFTRSLDNKNFFPPPNKAPSLIKTSEHRQKAARLTAKG